MSKKDFGETVPGTPYPHASTTFSLPADYYDKLSYVADYFGWPVSKLSAWIIMRAVSGVSYGDDLVLSEWRDPRFKLESKTKK